MSEQVLGINGDQIDYDELRKAEEQQNAQPSPEGENQDQPNFLGEPPADEPPANEDTEVEAQPEIDLSKFEGQDRDKILESYTHLQKDHGRLGSEVGQLRKEKEALEERLKTLQGQPFTPVAPPQHTTPQPMPAEDPAADLEKLKERWEEGDQFGAMVSLIQRQQASQKQERMEEVIATRNKEAAEYVNTKSQDPDFVRRLQVMQNLAHTLNPLVKPEYAGSREVMQVLDLISKGLDVDHYVKAGLEKAQQAKSSINQEKRNAGASERPSVGGAGKSIDPWGEDMDVLAKQLGRVER